MESPTLSAALATAILPTVDLTPLPAILVAPQHNRIVAANAAARTLFEAPSLDGRRFTDFVDSSFGDLAVYVQALHHFGERWTRSLDMLRAGEEPFRAEIRGRYLDTENGPFLFLCILDLTELDVHEVKQQEDRLQKSGLTGWRRAEGFFADLERRNHLILDAAGEGIYGINTDGFATFVNRSAQEILGWTADDLLGRDVHALIHYRRLNGEAFHHHDCPIFHSFRSAQVHRVEDDVFWSKEGRPVFVEYVSTPIYDQKVLVGAVVVFRDVTERRENERRLRAALEEVQTLRDRLEQENAYLQDEITSQRAHGALLGQSPAIRTIAAQIDLVASSEAPVLITGETGTGKSLIASAIHKASPRRRRPLIRLNCAAVQPGTFEAELFGRADRGGDPVGKLELASGGTLFLEEVSEIPLDLQDRLLETLAKSSVRRSQDARPRSIDIRIVASSKRNLEREIASGRFREALFFHLNVVPIACPPLRKRMEDIPLLAAHFLRQTCRRLYKPEPVITKGAIEQLSAYPWPGNVRELENDIERAAILTEGGKLMVDLTQRSVSDRLPASILTERDLRQIEADALIACLRKAGGKVSGADGAAALMGIRPTTFHSRVKAHGLTMADWT